LRPRSWQEQIKQGLGDRDDRAMGVCRLDQIRHNLGVSGRDIEPLCWIDGKIEQEWWVVNNARLRVVVRAAGDEVCLVLVLTKCPELTIPVVEQLAARARRIARERIVRLSTRL
jgi:hypothetical protein